jgi:hypothetical protein
MDGDQHQRFYQLFEKIQDFFSDKSQMKDFQKVLVQSYLSDPFRFEESCRNCLKDKSTSNHEIVTDLIQSYLHPALIPFHDIHEDWCYEPFEAFT